MPRVPCGRTAVIVSSAGAGLIVLHDRKVPGYGGNLGPQDVPNDGVAGRGVALHPGLVIAIEPWFLAGSPKIVIDRDGWTIRSVDRSRGVHVEHTVAITADGPLVLTARDAVAASAPVRATATGCPTRHARGESYRAARRRA